MQNKQQKSSVPYITYKPGFYGTLDVRFFTNWKEWRSHLIFSYPNSKNIKTIKTIFNEYPKESFTVENENNSVSLFDSESNQLNSFDSIQVKHYLTHFNKINYNQIELPAPWNENSFWLLGLKANLTLTNKIFFSNLFQYNEQLGLWNFNSRFQWRYKPASDIFLVFNSNEIIVPKVSRGWSLTLKVNYWLNL